MVTASSIAQQYLGIKEQGKNRGFILKYDGQRGFEQMLRSFGWRPGLPWCAFFAKLVIYRSYGPDVARILNGGVHASWNAVKANPNWKIDKRPLVDGLVFWDTGEGHGHVGIVVSDEGVTFHTVEGNTNTKGSREGDGVLMQVRPVVIANKSWSLLGFARPISYENTTASV